MRRGLLRLHFVLVATCAASACAARGPLARQECVDPDRQLAAVLKPFEELRASGCTAGCEPLRREIERLAVVCATHAPTLMANAVLAYDERQPAAAQQYLDLMLAQPGRHPDAGVLRARIAAEEGNLAFARRLLEAQISLTPDHAGLHETYGAVLYLGRQLVEAVRELTTAEALGAPRWRIAYHLGLIDEAASRWEEAVKHYMEAIAGNPGWAPAESRLKALRAAGRPPAPSVE
ncbi:MAG: hypothetical protein ACT4QD_24490 [Acidobacteriota bacterium]